MVDNSLRPSHYQGFQSIDQPSSSKKLMAPYELKRIVRKFVSRALRLIRRQQKVPHRNPVEFFRPNLEANAELKAHLDATRRERRICKGLDEAVNIPYYWGHIDRHEAAQTLEGLGHGSFLLRDSSHPDFRFAVSFRCADSTVHARIARYKGNYSFKLEDTQRFSAPTLMKFVEHYNKLERFLFDEPYLSKPINRKKVFSLKELCSAVVAAEVTLNNVETLPIPQRSIEEIIKILEG